MKFQLILLALLLPMLTIAQQNEGEILFKETVKLNIELPEGHEDMKAMMPSSQSFHRSLLFTESASLYRDYESTGDEDMEFEGESGGAQIKMVMKAPENTQYTDLENGVSVNSREFFGRMFLVTGDAAKRPWKLTGKTKKVLEYTCQQATYQDEERKVEAWFAPEIPVSAGPSEFSGLPGLILEVNIDDDARTMTAVRVEFKDVADDAIEKPTKGKSMTQEEFDKMEEEKMREMGAEEGGGGVRMIIRN